jgi:hypothetical protein
MNEMVATIVDLYRIIHKQLRQELDGLDDEAVNWVPGDDMNSMTVMVTHMLGAEEEIFQFTRGESAGRDRDAEFAVGPRTASELSARIDTADEVLRAELDKLTLEDLGAPRSRPDTPARPGAWWLLRNYGHTQLHLGHVQLTRQLYLRR